MGSSDYMIIRHEKMGWLDILNLLIFRPRLSDCKFVDACLSHDTKLSDTPGYLVAISLLIQKLFLLIEYPLRLFGFAIEFPFNLVTANGGVLSLIVKFLTGMYKKIHNVFYRITKINSLSRLPFFFFFFL